MLNEDNRDNIDIFYMKMAYLTSERATCVRRRVGSVITRDKMLLSSGYNGAPSGIEHCNKDTCIRLQMNIPSGEKPNLCIGSHSEINAIAQAARNGVNINNSTIYCTTFPCIYCAKAIVNAGIKRLVYCESYGNMEDPLTKKILQNITVDKITKKEIFNS